MSERPKVSVDDWIRISTLWPGIWRVSRVLAGFNELRWSLDQEPFKSDRILLFCDRIVNDNWKRSFSTRSCDASYVTLLSNEESTTLESVLASDPKLKDSFDEYQATPHPLDLIANVSLGGLNEELVAHFPQICDEMLRPRIEQGVTAREVLELLQARDLIRNIAANPLRVTLQLRSVDHEVRSNEFVFKHYRTMGS
jgi:hypothetical protein